MATSGPFWGVNPKLPCQTAPTTLPEAVVSSQDRHQDPSLACMAVVVLVNGLKYSIKLPQ